MFYYRGGSVCLIRHSNGVTLEAEWMEEMEKSPGFSEVREFAETLRKAGRLEHDFSEIEQAWKRQRNRNRHFQVNIILTYTNCGFFRTIETGIIIWNGSWRIKTQVLDIIRWR